MTVGRTFSSSSPLLTTNDIRNVDQHGGLQAFQLWIIYKIVKIRDLPSFSLIWHLYLYFCCYRQLSPPTSSQGAFPWLWSYGKAPWGRGCSGLVWPQWMLGYRSAWPNRDCVILPASSVWVIVFQICRLLNCEERLPLLVFDSVFWGVSSTEVVLFPVNSCTRKTFMRWCYLCNLKFTIWSNENSW